MKVSGHPGENDSLSEVQSTNRATVVLTAVAL